MMNDEHERFRALVTKLVEGAADAAERAQVESHLAGCPECRADCEAERRSKEAMIRETRAFYEGYDAGRLKANLEHELRSGNHWTRGLGALGALLGLLTLVLFVMPPASQPQAWTLALPLTGGCLAALVYILRRRTRMAAIARAAEVARGGYRDLERARVEVEARDFRTCARFGLVVAFLLPILLSLFAFLQRRRLRHAFPQAEVHVNISEGLIHVAVVSVFLIATGLYFLRKARRLEASHAESMKGADDRR
jgi:hypothetical protein